jgi:enoyl-[acyl-carrier protein] reductase/trans-2-enoyl-CoA reductase (NAD+)
MPLYLAMVFKVMRAEGLHEGCMDQIYRLFSERLYNNHNPAELTDDKNRLRLDDWELREDVQQACRDLWPTINDANLFSETDYQLYKDEFLKLFGFGVKGVDYDAEVSPEAKFEVITL